MRLLLGKREVIRIKRVASMHLQSIILKRGNAHRFINNHVQYDLQSNDIINSDEKWRIGFLTNEQVFTFAGSYSFHVSLHTNNILCGPCLKLS